MEGIMDFVVDGGVFITTRENLVSININVMFVSVTDGGSGAGVKGNA
jgi:hypothetical protein